MYIGPHTCILTLTQMYIGPHTDVYWMYLLLMLIILSLYIQLKEYKIIYLLVLIMLPWYAQLPLYRTNC